MRLGKVLIGSGVAAAVAAATVKGRQVERIPAFSGRPISVVGHRGACGHAPENTLPSFERAVALGAHAVELDVRLTADGHPVVLHDPTVDRTTDGSGPVGALTLDEVRALDAGYRWQDAEGAHPFRGEGLTVPTFAEALEALPDTFLVIELKREAGLDLPARVADAIRRCGREDSVLLASDDAALLEVARDRLPQTPTNLAETEARRFYGLHLLGLHRRWRGSGRILQVPEAHDGRLIVTPRFVAAAHDVGLDVHVWTVNEPATVRRLLDAGVDGFVTDYPDVVAETITAAGL